MKKYIIATLLLISIAPHSFAEVAQTNDVSLLSKDAYTVGRMKKIAAKSVRVLWQVGKIYFGGRLFTFHGAWGMENWRLWPEKKNKGFKIAYDYNGRVTSFVQGEANANSDDDDDNGGDDEDVSIVGHGVTKVPGFALFWHGFVGLLREFEIKDLKELYAYLEGKDKPTSEKEKSKLN